MKLPFNISAIGGAFSRLNPAGLIAKIKAKKGGEVEDEEDDEDLFGDLGDLDKLDNEAAEAAAETERGESGEDDEEHDLHDFDEAAFEDDDNGEPDVLDEVDAPEFADLNGDDDLLAPPGPGDDEGDLVAEIMDKLDDFDMGGALDDEEDEEKAQKAKVKKLAIMAGGGVAVAVVLGGVAWWVMSGGDEPAPNAETVAETTPLPAAKPGELVIDLNDVPPFADDQPIVSAQPEPTRAPSAQTGGEGAGGLAPPTAQGVAPAPASAPQAAVKETGEISELKKLGLDVQIDPGAGVVIPSVTKASFASLSTWPAAEPLREAPLLTLVEQGEHGQLPKIGKDGDSPFSAYRRPPPAEKNATPKIAIIVTGLGMSRASTEAAIAGMPADVTLALDVYARGLDFWIKRARQAGHEVLLSMPSESADFPFSDPGPNALKSLAPPDENIKQLEWMLSRTTGYVGVLSVYGSKFLSVEEQVQNVLQDVKRRGLMYVDGGAEDSIGTRVAYKVGAKWATSEMTLDSSPGKKALVAQLEEFEALAKKRAMAIARISTDPSSLEGLSTWLKSLKEKGLELVPVSSLANKQLIR